MENNTQSVAALTVAPMIDAYVAAVSSHRLDAGVSGRFMSAPAVGVTPHATGQVSIASANAAFIKAWAPPPRQVSL